MEMSNSGSSYDHLMMKTPIDAEDHLSNNLPDPTTEIENNPLNPATEQGSPTPRSAGIYEFPKTMFGKSRKGK